MARLTWKRESRERGLAAVCQGERGFDLRLSGKRLASVRPIYKGLSREKIGYYWYGGDDYLGIPWKNTSDAPKSTLEEAKVECLEYVKGCLEVNR